MSEFEEITPTVPAGKSRELASVFDRLVDSNIQLVTSVGKLVKLTWAVIAFNAALVAIVILILAGHR